MFISQELNVKFLESNENENTIYLSANVKKPERSQTNNLMMQLQLQANKNHPNSKAGGAMKIRAEINKLETETAMHRFVKQRIDSLKNEQD